jgi:hypothetical protein
MKTVPKTAQLLGYAGLIPFVGLTLGIIFSSAQTGYWLAWVQTGYAVAIFSFIGAIYWGLALADPDLSREQRDQAFAWGVVPALLAVACLMLPHSIALFALALLGVLVWMVDLFFSKRMSLPAGWMRLRSQLSLVACTSLFVSGLILF